MPRKEPMSTEKLTPLQLAVAIVRMRQADFTVKEISYASGLSVSYIYRLLKLAEKSPRKLRQHYNISRDNSRKPIYIRTNAATLAKAMFEGANLTTFNTGVYQGTKIPLRRINENEPIEVIGSTTGAKVIATEAWIADRFGNLGARQIKRLRDIMKIY